MKKKLILSMLLISSCSTFNDFKKSEKIRSDYEDLKIKLEEKNKKDMAYNDIQNKKFESENVKKFLNDSDFKIYFDKNVKCNMRNSECSMLKDSFTLDKIIYCKKELQLCAAGFETYNKIAIESENILKNITEDQDYFFREINLIDGNQNIVFKNSNICTKNIKYGYFEQDYKSIKKLGGRIDFWSVKDLKGKFENLEKCEEARAILNSHLTEPCEGRYLGQNIFTVVYKLKVFDRSDYSSYFYRFSNKEYCEDSAKNGLVFLDPRNMNNKEIGKIGSDLVLKFIGKCEKEILVNCKNGDSKFIYEDLLK